MCHFDGCGYEESEKKKNCLIKSTFLRMSVSPTDLVPAFPALSLISPISSMSPKARDCLRHLGLLSQHLLFSLPRTPSPLLSLTSPGYSSRHKPHHLTEVALLPFHHHDCVPMIAFGWAFIFGFPPLVAGIAASPNIYSPGLAQNQGQGRCSMGVWCMKK